MESNSPEDDSEYEDVMGSESDLNSDDDDEENDDDDQYYSDMDSNIGSDGELSEESYESD